MEFFNPQTEVLRFQFTSYGLEELSKGKFDPSIFIAFDDGVVYDSSLSEEEFLEDVRLNRVFVKTNKLPYELEATEPGQDSTTQNVVYSVREELEGEDNLARSSFHVRISGTEIASSTQDIGGISLTLEPLFALKSGEIPLSEIENRSETETTNLCLVDGKYFMFENGHILVDVSEGGTIPQPENFECFLYELIDGEEIRVDLQGNISSGDIFEPKEEITTFRDVQILCDDEIPDEILCAAKASMFAGDQSNVFLVDGGVVSSETAGKSCKLEVGTKPAVYFGRNEGVLGDGCRND